MREQIFCHTLICPSHKRCFIFVSPSSSPFLLFAVALGVEQRHDAFSNTGWTRKGGKNDAWKEFTYKKWTYSDFSPLLSQPFHKLSFPFLLNIFYWTKHKHGGKSLSSITLCMMLSKNNTNVNLLQHFLLHTSLYFFFFFFSCWPLVVPLHQLLRCTDVGGAKVVVTFKICWRGGIFWPILLLRPPRNVDARISRYFADVHHWSCPIPYNQVLWMFTIYIPLLQHKYKKYTSPEQ